MTTTYWKKMKMTWLFWWPFVFTIGLWSTNASAWCLPPDGDGFVDCQPNNPPGDTSHSYAAYIGSDPNDDYTQWIAWYDLTTDQCNGWDMIGGLGGSGGLDHDTRVIGLYGYDYLTTVPSTSTICGHELAPPVGNGYGLYFHSDFWDGGFDQHIDYVIGGSMVGSLDGTDFHSWTTSSIYGGDWYDRLWKWGSPGAYGIWMGGGYDQVHILSSTYHSGNCGGGSDYWCGPGPGAASGCETVDTTCP